MCLAEDKAGSAGHLARTTKGPKPCGHFSPGGYGCGCCWPSPCRWPRRSSTAWRLPPSGATRLPGLRGRCSRPTPPSPPYPGGRPARKEAARRSADLSPPTTGWRGETWLRRPLALVACAEERGEAARDRGDDEDGPRLEGDIDHLAGRRQRVRDARRDGQQLHGAEKGGITESVDVTALLPALKYPD